jgi:hypothetical protein
MNRNVPYGRWLHAHMVNIAFYDKYGDGVAERKKAIDYYVRVGDFKYTKKMAQELIRMGRISFKVALFALLPTYVVYILYRIRQRKK